MEEKQADSKLFWSKVKQLRGSIGGAKKPPPIATDKDGKTETDPEKVLRIWREFSAGIASSKNKQEEGIYDDEHRDKVEERLHGLREEKEFQEELDYPITESEVFHAEVSVTGSMFRVLAWEPGIPAPKSSRCMLS